MCKDHINNQLMPQGFAQPQNAFVPTVPANQATLAPQPKMAPPAPSSVNTTATGLPSLSSLMQKSGMNQPLGAVNTKIPGMPAQATGT